MSGTEPIVGILGGMGPEATVELMRRIVARTPAAGDSDHIRCIVDQNGKVPNRTIAINAGDKTAGEVLADMAKRLTAYGADMLCMPCNTAHYFLPHIREASSLPFVDMLECTARRVRQNFPDATRAAVLCTVGTRQTGLYEKRLAKEGITAVYPPAMQQELLMKVITAVKAGDSGDSVRADFQQVMDYMGSDAGGNVPVMIAACTELSVICPPQSTHPHVVDALDALVDELIARVKG